MIGRRLRRETAALTNLVDLVREHLWFLPPAVVLGLCAFLVEGIGLALLVPLFHVLGGTLDAAASGAFIVEWMERTVASLPVEHQLVAVVLAMLAAIILKGIIHYANAAIFVIADARAGDGLRQRCYSRLIRLPLARVEEDSSGRFLNTIGTETWRVSEALGVVFGAVTSLCAFLVFVTLLLLLSWQLTLLALALMSTIPLLLHLLTRNAERLGRAAVAANTLLAERMWASISGLRVIRAFGREGHEVDRFSAASSAVSHSFARLGLIKAATGPTTETLVTVIVAVLALTIDPASVGLPVLVAFLAVLYRLQPHARHLIGARVALLGYVGAVDAVRDLLASDEDPALRRGGLPFTGLTSAIELRDLWYSYPTAVEPALAGVSCRLPKGSMVAVVGPSGAGKSTLLDLLLGFGTPDRGRILIDSHPLEELDIIQWRGHVGVVGQDSYIADTTIRENLCFGLADASEAELWDALALASAEAFVRELPARLDTEVGERGVRLSGGERQRLALARALVRRPDLLVLDEATNALDSRTERTVQTALARLAGSCTILIVAHRLATVEHADQILVLDRGRVVESGDFRTLIRADGLFAQMYRLQRLGHDLEEVA